MTDEHRMWIADSPEPASKFLPVVFERNGHGRTHSRLNLSDFLVHFRILPRRRAPREILAMPFFISFCHEV